MLSVISVLAVLTFFLSSGQIEERVQKEEQVKEIQRVQEVQQVQEVQELQEVQKFKKLREYKIEHDALISNLTKMYNTNRFIFYINTPNAPKSVFCEP